MAPKYPKRKSKSKSKKNDIKSIARKVNKLIRQKRVNAQWYNLARAELNQNIAQFYHYNMCLYSGMAPIFGTTTDDLADPKILYHSSKVQCRVSLENTINNEEETTRFSAFLVSLRDRIPQSRFNSGTGVLTLTAGLDYYLNQGIAYINPKMFNIHKVKYFTLTNYGTALSAPAGQSQFGTAHEWTWSIMPKMTVEHPAGNWSALASSLDPSRQYYVLIFSDNQTGDAEYPTVSISQVANFKEITGQ